MVRTIGVVCVYPLSLGVVSVFVDGAILGRGVNVVIWPLGLDWFFGDLWLRSVLSLGESGHVYFK